MKMYTPIEPKNDGLEDGFFAYRVVVTQIPWKNLSGVRISYWKIRGFSIQSCDRFRPELPEALDFLLKLEVEGQR